MRKRFVVLMFTSLLAVLAVHTQTSHARFYLLDHNVELNGSIEEKWNFKYDLKDWEKGRGEHNPNGIYSDGGHVENPAMLKTHLHLEALCHAYQQGTTVLDFYTLFEWFYDISPDINPAWRRGMASYDRNKYQTPHGWEMVRELYLNYVNGPWTLRLGKQMVVWGETGLQRTADVVNPLDTRSHMMGVDDWEDFKKGLWMFRGFYQTSFKNDLTFETIFVPYDVQAMDLPPEGSMYNTTYTGGFTSRMWRRWKHDEVNEHGLHDAQGGFRIRGFNWDWDWTVLWYNGYEATPVCVDWGQREDTYKPRTPMGSLLHLFGLRGFTLWSGEYNANLGIGGPSPGYPTNTMFRYYRGNNIGATATKYIYKLPVFGLFEIPFTSNVRFEFAYKPHTHFNRMYFIGGDLWGVKNVTRRDLIGYAVEIGHDFMPQFICRYNGQRSVDLTLGFFQDWILNHDRNLYLEGYNRGKGDVSSTSFSLDITTDWFDQELMTKLNYSYNTTGYGAFYAFFQYAPGQHWRFTLLPRITWSNAGPFNNKADRKGNKYTLGNDTQNYIHFKIGYLF
jgi:hypothetical protein